MRKCWPVFSLLLLTAILLAGCDAEPKRNSRKEPRTFTNIWLAAFTPVKDQGKSNGCWAYAMLSMIESEHILMGDSVNLSPAYAMRKRLEDEFRRYYLSQGTHTFTLRGMGQTLINTIAQYGIMPYDAYPDRSGMNTENLREQLNDLAEVAIKRRTGLETTDRYIQPLLDETFGPMPKQVSMYSVEYTPLEFAHSVFRKDEYVGVTSFTHHPFGSTFALEVPDNWEHNTFFNVPLDTLSAYARRTVSSGHTFVWEGDISNLGFSFRNGTAMLRRGARVSQEARQRDFERFVTTDDHCMHCVGMARDQNGELFYIMKNSWGKDNPYGGLVYMSEEYLRLCTIALYIPTNVF